MISLWPCRNAVSYSVDATANHKRLVSDKLKDICAPALFMFTFNLHLAVSPPDILHQATTHLIAKAERERPVGKSLTITFPWLGTVSYNLERWLNGFKSLVYCLNSAGLHLFQRHLSRTSAAFHTSEMSVSVCLSVFVCMHVYMCASAYVQACVCVCVCVRMCVRACARSLNEG